MSSRSDYLREYVIIPICTMHQISCSTTCVCLFMCSDNILYKLVCLEHTPHLKADHKAHTYKLTFQALIQKEALFWAKCLFPEDADLSRSSNCGVCDQTQNECGFSGGRHVTI